jgi:hypothetical protein
MLSNYFKIAVRNLMRSRTYSLINVITLAFLTLAVQAVRAATANPVKSLRYE